MATLIQSDSKSAWLHLQRPYVQIKSRSQVLEFRTFEHYLFGTYHFNPLQGVRYLPHSRKASAALRPEASKDAVGKDTELSPREQVSRCRMCCKCSNVTTYNLLSLALEKYLILTSYHHSFCALNLGFSTCFPLTSHLLVHGLSSSQWQVYEAIS